MDNIITFNILYRCIYIILCTGNIYIDMEFDDREENKMIKKPKYAYAYNTNDKMLIDVSRIVTINIINGSLYINGNIYLTNDKENIKDFIEFYCNYHLIEYKDKALIYKKLGVDFNGEG